MSNLTFNDITVLIVTYKSQKVLLKCLKNLRFLKKILILDNSKDFNLKSSISRKYKNVKFFISKNNVGYGAGNNFLLRKVRTKFAIILNPDCYISAKIVSKILNFIKKSNIDFGIIGSKNEAKILEKRNIHKIKYFLCDYVKGFFMFLNLKNVKKTKFFDENFFLYLEEIDFCKRVKKSGYEVLAISNLEIKHLAGRSCGNREEYKKLQAWHWAWSQYYFSKKYKGSFLSLILFIPKLFKYFFKSFYDKKKELNSIKFNGLLASILKKKSFYRC